MRMVLVCRAEAVSLHHAEDEDEQKKEDVSAFFLRLRAEHQYWQSCSCSGNSRTGAFAAVASIFSMASRHQLASKRTFDVPRWQLQSPPLTAEGSRQFSLKNQR